MVKRHWSHLTARQQFYRGVSLIILALVASGQKDCSSDPNFSGNFAIREESLEVEVDKIVEVDTPGQTVEIDSAMTSTGDLKIATVEIGAGTFVITVKDGFLDGDTPPEFEISPVFEGPAFDIQILTQGTTTIVVQIETDGEGNFMAVSYDQPAEQSDWTRTEVGEGTVQHTIIDQDGDQITSVLNRENRGTLDVYRVTSGGRESIQSFSAGQGQGDHQDPFAGSSHHRIFQVGDGTRGLFWRQVFQGVSIPTVTTFPEGEAPIHIEVRREAQPLINSLTIDTDVRVQGNELRSAHYTPLVGGGSSLMICNTDLVSGDSQCSEGEHIADFNNRFQMAPAIELLSQLERNCVLSFRPGTQNGPAAQERGVGIFCVDGATIFSRKIELPYEFPAMTLLTLPSWASERNAILAAFPLNSVDLFRFSIVSRLYLPHFVKSEGLFSQLSLVNFDADEAAQAELLFRGQDGQAMDLDRSGEDLTIPGSEVPGRLEIEILAGGRATFQTNADGETVVGSVIVNSDRPLAGAVVFGGEFGLAGVGTSEAGDEGFTAPVETSGSTINTGIAVMSLSDSTVQLQARLCDSAGKLLASAAPVDLPAQGQMALFVTEFDWDSPIDFSDFKGVLKVTADGRTAAAVLQTRPGQFASLPVAAQ